MDCDYSPFSQDKHWLLRQPANPMKSSSLDFLDNAYKKRYDCRSFIEIHLMVCPSDSSLPLGLRSISAAVFSSSHSIPSAVVRLYSGKRCPDLNKELTRESLRNVFNITLMKSTLKKTTKKQCDSFIHLFSSLFTS